MLSFLVVVFSVFNHVHGATCVIRRGEDVDCTTACNADCSDYLRESTGERKHDAACAAGETVQDCKSIQSKIGGNFNPCRNKNQWLDIVWDAATDAQKDTGTPPRTISDFNNYWRAPCQIEKSSLGGLQSVSCDDYHRRHAIDSTGAAFSVADPAAPGRTRDYLYLIRSTFGKYCDASVGGRAAMRAFRDEIFTAFTEKATVARAVARRERAVSAEAAAFRGAGRGRGMGRPIAHARPPPVPRGVRVRPAAPAGRAHPAGVPGAGAPPPPPRPPGAHAEYVDTLWNEVNQMEEDELRYERALDKLRRAQRSFDMATKLRKLHKKKLRQYYH